MKRYANEPFRELTAPSATNAFRSFIPRLAGPSRINKDISECVNKIPEGGGGGKCGGCSWWYLDLWWNHWPPIDGLKSRRLPRCNIMNISSTKKKPAVVVSVAAASICCAVVGEWRSGQFAPIRQTGGGRFCVVFTPPSFFISRQMMKTSPLISGRTLCIFVQTFVIGRRLKLLEHTSSVLQGWIILFD